MRSDFENKRLRGWEDQKGASPETRFLFPVAQKVTDNVVFDVSKVKESIFFKSDITDPPPQILDVHLL